MLGFHRHDKHGKGGNRTYRKSTVPTGVACGLAAVVLAGCGGPAESGSGLVWGTSSVGSSYYNLAVAFSDTVTRNTDLESSVQAVGGSTATVHAIVDGKTDLGVSNTLAATTAFEGEGDFEQPAPLRMIAQGDKTLRQLVVRADSGIETPADLEGKRIIGERPPLPEVRWLTDAILAEYGVDPETVDIHSTADTKEALDALENGTVDGAVLPGGVGAANLTELAETTEVRFVDLSAQMDGLLERLGPAFSEGVTPAGTYKGQTEDVATPALTSLLVTTSDLPEQQANDIARAIFENPQRIASVPRGDAWTAENSMSQAPTIPLHPGAVSYYEEAGVWTEEMQRAQDELAAR